MNAATHSSAVVLVAASGETSPLGLVDGCSSAAGPCYTSSSGGELGFQTVYSLAQSV